MSITKEVIEIEETFKNFFRNILKLGTEKDKNQVIEQITEYYNRDLYKSKTYTI